MSTRREVTIGIIFGILAAIAYGTTHVLVRQGVTILAPPIVGAAVSLFAGSLILSVLSMSDREQKLSQKKGAVWFFVVAGIIAGLGIASNYMALSLAPVVVVTPITGTSPIFTLLWSHLFLSHLERITPRIILGTVLVLGGAALVTLGRAT